MGNWTIWKKLDVVLISKELTQSLPKHAQAPNARGKGKMATQQPNIATTVVVERRNKEGDTNKLLRLYKFNWYEAREKKTETFVSTMDAIWI